MSEGQNSERPAGVKFWFWRTSRGTAVAICLALFMAAVACAIVVVQGVVGNQWLYLVAMVLAVMTGQSINAIRRTILKAGSEPDVHQSASVEPFIDRTRIDRRAQSPSKERGW